MRRFNGWVLKAWNALQNCDEGAQRKEMMIAEKVVAFDNPHYAGITEARLQHLESLGLTFSGKTVIDVGCGVGRLSEFFVQQGCDVFCVDGRPENIHRLKSFYPNRKAEVVDLETDEVLKYGGFDIVFCYGILYHLADTFSFLRRTYRICNEMMIIETCITDAEDMVLRLVPEDQKDVTQSLGNHGCRPSPSYVVACLRKSGFKHVYNPIHLPNHAEFQYQRSNDYSYLKKGRPIRDIFIASHHPVKSQQLRSCVRSGG